jgi:hypothetical protein
VSYEELPCARLAMLGENMLGYFPLMTQKIVEMDLVAFLVVVFMT